MNTQPPTSPKASTNGAQQSGGEREGGSNKAESTERPWRDRLVYLTTCKIGHPVEAYLKNGSVYSGIFHTADVEKDFGIILKMARLIKDGTLRGDKSRYDFVRKPPTKTFVIPADELVQVVAKDVSVSRDSILNVTQSEKSPELLTDSSISKSYHGNVGRPLQPWVPHEDVPRRPDLENVFDYPNNRPWDQFAANKSLFGVKSTFDEEFYTTKLKKTFLTKGLEEQATRIAREIEGENTGDLHVAEERGHQLNEKFDMDDETKYSSVRQPDGFDDSGFGEEDDTLLDTCNDQTFGGASSYDGQKTASSSKGNEEILGDGQSSRDNTNVDPNCSVSHDHARHPPLSKDFPAPGSSISENQLGERRNNNNPAVSHESRSAEESISGHGDINEGAKSGSGATSASKAAAEREGQVSQVSGKTKSPSSSEKSTLNPNAKEFKLNPDAKIFKPSQAVVAAQPRSPVIEPSYYYPGPVQQMPGMPPGAYGAYSGQPTQMVYPYPQTYYPPNAPQHLQQQQQMMQGPSPVYYLPPSYRQDMP